MAAVVLPLRLGWWCRCHCVHGEDGSGMGMGVGVQGWVCI